MQQIKLYYLNDEQFQVTVKWPKLGGEPWEYEYRILTQGEGAIFEIELSEGHMPWVKKWDKTVMINSFSEAVLASEP